LCKHVSYRRAIFKQTNALGFCSMCIFSFVNTCKNKQTKHAHLDVLDAGVRVEDLLDLQWVDVLPAPDDHVLHAPRDPDEPLAVHDSLVAASRALY